MSLDILIRSVKDIFQTDQFIPLHEPSFTDTDESYVLDCIKGTFVSSVGQYVDAVEEELARITQTKKSTVVVNGTAALQVALRLSGVKNGDEVITQALTFVATANAIVYNGASPIFLDVDLDTMGLSPVALESWLNENAELKEGRAYNRKTGKLISACMPMHTFGFICKIEEIVRICKPWGIAVVEDAAEALGSKRNENAAGTFGLLGALSFNGNKIVTAGGGGAIISTDQTLTEKAKYLTTTAKVPHNYEYVHNEVGYNFRMPNLNAALLMAQLERLELVLTKKKELFSSYIDLFGDKWNIVQPPKETEWNHWLISVLCENKRERDDLLEESNRNGVMTRPIWRLMHKLPMYDNCQRDAQKNASFLEDRIVNIPSSVKIR